MTCLVQHLKGIACIACKRADQVYMGHGVIRFCAHCSISWDPMEDGKPLDNQKKAIILSEDQDGELPEDMLERMGILIGDLTIVFGFERRLTDMMAIPEALFTEDQVKHLPGQHDQRTHGRGGGSRSSLLISELEVVTDDLYKKGKFESFLVRTEDGQLAIAKPEVEATEGREILAYEIAQAVGYDAIPLTVEREIDGKKVSVQKWVDEPMAWDTKTPMNESDLRRQYVFDYVTNNSDRHKGNYLVSDKGRITSIDQGLAFDPRFESNWPLEVDDMISRSKRRDNIVSAYVKEDFEFITSNKQAILDITDKFNKSHKQKVNQDMLSMRIDNLAFHVEYELED